MPLTLGLAAASGAIGYLLGRWWLFLVPAVLGGALKLALETNQDWYERVPEDVQWPTYVGLGAAAAAILVGTVLGRLRLRRRGRAGTADADVLGG